MYLYFFTVFLFKSNKAFNNFLFNWTWKMHIPLIMLMWFFFFFPQDTLQSRGERRQRVKRFTNFSHLKNWMETQTTSYWRKIKAHSLISPGFLAKFSVRMEIPDLENHHDRRVMYIPETACCGTCHLGLPTEYK